MKKPFVIELIAAYPTLFLLNCLAWAATFLLPLLPAYAVKDIFGALENSELIGSIPWIVGWWATAHFLRIPFAYAASFFDARFRYSIQQRLYRTLMPGLFEHKSYLQPQPAPADLSYSIQTDIDSICTYLYWVACMPGQIGLAFAGLMPLLAPELILYLFCIVMLIFLIGHGATRFQQHIERARKRIQHDTQQVSDALSQIAHNREMILLHRRESMFLALIHHLSRKKRDSILMEILTSQTVELLFYALSQGCAALIITLLSYQLYHGAISLPIFIFVVTYMPLVVDSAYYAGCYVTNYYQSSVAYERLVRRTHFDTVNYQPVTERPQDPLQEVHIELKIPKKDPLAPPTQLLTIRPGELILLQGPSGSGKSKFLHELVGLAPTGTLVNLQWNNKLIIDRFAFCIPPHVALARQKIQLIPGRSLRENICRGHSNPTLLQDLLKATGLASDLLHQGLSLEQQLDAVETLPLSTQQRIALARALFQPADLYLLDEVTTALDSITEQRIIQIIRTYHPSSAVLMATHRTDNNYLATQLWQFKPQREILVTAIPQTSVSVERPYE